MPINGLHLRAFHAVADAGSFTAAARDLHITQPTLSEQVGALERRYDVSLFSRRGRSIALTPLGEQLHRVTARLDDLDREAEQLLRSAGELRTGTLRLGSDAPVHAMPLLARFTARYPQLGIALTSGNSDDVRTALLGHHVDVAVVALTAPDPRLASVALHRDRLAAVVPAGHPLAARRRVRLTELVGERLVMREHGSTSRRLLEQGLDRIGETPRETLQVDTREGVHAAVAAGLGVAAVAASEVPDDPRLVAVTLVEPALTCVEHLACLADRRHDSLATAVFALLDPAGRRPSVVSENRE